MVEPSAGRGLASRATDRSERVELDEWPLRKKVFLTLDLECDYGTFVDRNFFYATEETPRLARLLEHHDVPLSCFLQTQLLDEAPEAVDALERTSAPVEFHAHTHSHPRRERADVQTEVRESVTRVRDRFGTDPVGFRFPDGMSEPSDYRILARHGVSFNASLFPSWYPGKFNNATESRFPFRSASGVLELPFTVYSNRLRIPVSLAYVKLLGSPFSKLVRHRPPDVIVLNVHMHDLYCPPTFERLPYLYKLVYRRNRHRGFRLLENLVDALGRQGYDFELMSELNEAVREAIANRTERR